LKASEVKIALQLFAAARAFTQINITSGAKTFWKPAKSAFKAILFVKPTPMK